MTKGRWFGPSRLGGVFVLLFLAVMVLWPLVAVVRRSLVGVGPDRLVEIVSRGSVRSVLVFTTSQAVLSVIITLLVGLPIAHALARYDFRGRRSVRALAVVPFVLPTVVVATAFDALFDRLGVSLDNSLAAIIAAHVFFNVAVVVRIVGGFWSRLDRRQVAAARVLGAGPVRAFREITLRQLVPVLSGAAVLVFLFSFTSYGVILILGGADQATIETEIRRYAIFRQEFDVAAVLAMIQVVVVSTLALLSARFQRKHSAVAAVRRPTPALALDSLVRRVHLGLVMLLVIVVIVLPILALVERSLVLGDGSYGLNHYRALTTRAQVLPTSPARALANTLGFAFAAAFVASVVGVVAAKAVVAGGRLGRLLEFVTLIPLGVSAVTLGFGYLLAFTVLDLRRSIWLIPIAHAVIGLPFVLASVVPAMRSIDDRLRQAAASLGASPSAVRRQVEWPLVRRPVLSGAGFAMAVSIGEFGATSFLSRSSAGFTAPMAVFRLLGRPGTSLRGQALALSVIIGLLVAVLAALLERTRGDEVTLL
ncbi:MAG: thiamine transport system permease protein [Acidimicrobiales bacterium]|jgi:thiamine transport system permease protein